MKLLTILSRDRSVAGENVMPHNIPYILETSDDRLISAAQRNSFNPDGSFNEEDFGMILHHLVVCTKCRKQAIYGGK